jgi:glycosyltransferase involved in cell wall biosynthesis
VENPLPTLSVVVPIYNEAQSLPGLLPIWVQTCEKHGWDLILVDDGSGDETYQLLLEYGHLQWVKIIRHKVNRGYGGAVKSGIANVCTDYLVTLDADGQHDIADVENVFQLAIEKDADMVIGDRSDSQKSGWYREIGKWLILLFTNLLMRQHINDLNTGFRLMRTELANRYLYLQPDTFAFCVVITLFFISQRHLVLEIPVSCTKRKAGRSTINTYTAFQILMEIINIIMLFNPLKIFLPLSAISITVGTLWGIPYVLMGHGISVGAMLAIVIGALFFFLGLLASQLSAIRKELGDFHRREDLDAENSPQPAPQTKRE